MKTATLISLLVGVAVLFVVGYAVYYYLRKWKKEKEEKESKMVKLVQPSSTYTTQYQYSQPQYLYGY